MVNLQAPDGRGLLANSRNGGRLGAVIELSFIAGYRRFKDFLAPAAR
jgi:hypothetical protein